MNHYNRNILVVAENNRCQQGFDVYLVFSGQREYLFTHRHNGAMYCALQNGIRLADLQRSVREMDLQSIYKRRNGIVITKQLRNSMRYLLVIIDEYIENKEMCA